VQSCAVDRDALEVVRFHGADRAATVTVIATSAPFLPQQLRRLCDLDDSGLTFAIALGNRVVRQPEGHAQAITALSEARIAQFAAAASELLK
jgi:L-aminopeptidase/D-esterase-like protein